MPPRPAVRSPPSLAVRLVAHFDLEVSATPLRHLLAADLPEGLSLPAAPDVVVVRSAPFERLDRRPWRPSAAAVAAAVVIEVCHRYIFARTYSRTIRIVVSASPFSRHPCVPAVLAHLSRVRSALFGRVRWVAALQSYQRPRIPRVAGYCIVLFVDNVFIFYLPLALVDKIISGALPPDTAAVPNLSGVGVVKLGAILRSVQYWFEIPVELFYPAFVHARPRSLGKRGRR
uniref:Uncharacterized protein n=1 Tax=Trichuris muris TaxID=70415 RepID=A0A5S6QZH6_TRIMR